MQPHNCSSNYELVSILKASSFYENMKQEAIKKVALYGSCFDTPHHPTSSLGGSQTLLLRVEAQQVMSPVGKQIFIL